MKKHIHASSTPSRITRSNLQQQRMRSDIRWVLTISLCVVSFLCLIGIASAAQTGGGPFTTQKEQHLQQVINASRAQAHPHAKTGIQAPAAQPAPTYKAGIINMQQGPFSPSIFTVRNVWQGPIGSSWVLAYAGAKTNVNGSSGQGGIALYTETASTSGSSHLQSLGTFYAPAGTTALTITAEQGNLLQVRTDSGARLTFDLQAHQFQG